MKWLLVVGALVVVAIIVYEMSPMTPNSPLPSATMDMPPGSPPTATVPTPTASIAFNAQRSNALQTLFNRYKV